MSSALNVVYEDDFLLVVDKPSGLLMHPSWLDRNERDTLAGRIKRYLASQGIGASQVHTVHRLDRPTSGLVLVAKNVNTARHLSNQFKQHAVEKKYWAICRGFFPDHATIDYPLKEELDKIGDKTASKPREEQPAKTIFKTLGRAELAMPVSRYSKSRFSWLECSPLSGRKHQIRRHLKHSRHPIIGDTRYGCRHHNKVVKENLNLHALALRAVELTFVHPVLLSTMTLTSELNKDWQQRLATFGWR